MSYMVKFNGRPVKFGERNKMRTVWTPITDDTTAPTEFEYESLARRAAKDYRLKPVGLVEICKKHDTLK